MDANTEWSLLKLADSILFALPLGAAKQWPPPLYSSSSLSDAACDTESLHNTSSSVSGASLYSSYMCIKLSLSPTGRLVKDESFSVSRFCLLLQVIMRQTFSKSVNIGVTTLNANELMAIKPITTTHLSSYGCFGASSTLQPLLRSIFLWSPITLFLQRSRHLSTTRFTASLLAPFRFSFTLVSVASTYDIMWRMGAVFRYSS